MKKILVIDDSAIQRKMLISIIQKAGLKHEILEASNGEEGVTVLASHAPDVVLVLCDWDMPGKSGLHFIKGIAKAKALSKVPIVLMTTEGEEEEIPAPLAGRANVAGSVAKPFTPDQLKAAILPVLG